MAERAVDWYRARGDGLSRSMQWSLISALVHAGRSAEAVPMAAESLAESPDSVSSLGLVGTLAARLGDRGQALEMAERLRTLELECPSVQPVYWRACIAAQLGEKDQAIALLKEAFAQGYSFGVSIHRDIDLEPLWDYPPFIELLRPKG